ncbi:uncharacterized protein F5891DRAFT_949327, partial [Suillus fuscotomentosus]
LIDWTDNISRDITSFHINYMPEETFALPIQLHLFHVSIDESRQKNSFSSCTLVAAGHSFRGCLAYLLDLMIIHEFLALFSSLILVDMPRTCAITHNLRLLVRRQ